MRKKFIKYDIITVYGQRYICAAHTNRYRCEERHERIALEWKIRRTRMHNIRSLLRNETRYSSQPIHENIFSRIFGHSPLLLLVCLAHLIAAVYLMSIRVFFRYCLALAVQVRKRQCLWHCHEVEYVYLFSWLLLSLCERIQPFFLSVGCWSDTQVFDLVTVSKQIDAQISQEYEVSAHGTLISRSSFVVVRFSVKKVFHCRTKYTK